MPTYTIKLRRSLASDWTTVNPVLAEGEFGYEMDTRYFKVGDGVTAWNLLEYTVDEDQYLPDASALDDGKILLTFGGAWTIVNPPSGLPDPAGLPDGKMLITESEVWIVSDVPAGGGADPDAMHSSPPLLTYTYNIVEPTTPVDGDIWTDPDDSPPSSDAAVRAVVAAQLVEGTDVSIDPVGDTLVISAAGGPKDRRWIPASSHAQNREFRDDADLTGVIRVDNSVNNAAAQLRAIWSRGGDSLSLLLDGATTTDAAGELHGYVWPYALAVGEAISCYMLHAGLTYNYSFAGLVVSDGVDYAAGSQMLLPRWMTDSPAPANWTGWNTRGTNTDVPDAGLKLGYHLRIFRSATSTWLHQVSTDGVTWLTIDTRTMTFTPSHIGFAGGQWGGTGKRLFSFDYLRVSIP